MNNLATYWKRSPVTLTLIALCCIAYLGQVLMPALTNMGMYAVGIGFLEPWRFLTAGFLHASIVHLLMNMLVLLFVGAPLEVALGRWRFLALYLLSIIGGSAGLALWAGITPSGYQIASIGASGGGFGLFAAVYILQRSIGADMRPITVLLVVNLGFSFLMPGIGWQAHLGGLFIGALVSGGFVLAAKMAGKTRQKVFMQAGIAAANQAAKKQQLLLEVAVYVVAFLIILALCVPAFLRVVHLM